MIIEGGMINSDQTVQRFMLAGIMNRIMNKMQISNIMLTTRFWNNLHQGFTKNGDWKAN